MTAVCIHHHSSSGHEEIYTWLRRQGDIQGADKTVEAILAYDGLSPHWAYSGSARRWWGE